MGVGLGNDGDRDAVDLTQQSPVSLGCGVYYIVPQRLCAGSRWESGEVGYR